MNRCLNHDLKHVDEPDDVLDNAIPATPPLLQYIRIKQLYTNINRPENG